MLRVELCLPQRYIHSTVIVGDFNILLSIKNRTTIQKISKETGDLNNQINQIGLTDIYKALYTTTVEHTFFSRAYGTFSRIDHRPGHKLSLSRF